MDTMLGFLATIPARLAERGANPYRYWPTIQDLDQPAAATFGNRLQRPRGGAAKSSPDRPDNC